MSDWFFVSAWYEKGETEIHFEISNEDGEQYFFWLTVEVLNKKLTSPGSTSLDRFYYAEEEMLSLAVTILDEEMIEDAERIHITLPLFERYY